MASAEDAKGSRLLGRIVDPSARDDEGEEPELVIEDPLRVRALSQDAPVANALLEDASKPAQPGHPVRDRLLARATRAHERPAAAGSADSIEDVPLEAPGGLLRRPTLESAPSLEGTSSEPSRSGRSPGESSASDADSRFPPPLSGLEAELEAIAPPRRPGASRPSLAPLGTSFSPNLRALFGGLFGLATIASLFALLTELAPRGIVATTPAAPSPSGPSPVATADTKPVVLAPPRKRLPGPWRIADAANDPQLRSIEGTIGTEPFLRAVQNAGVPKSEAYRVLTAFKGHRDLDKCSRRDRFVALIERATQRLTAFEYIVSVEEVYQAKQNDRSLLETSRLDLKVERARIQGAIQLLDGGFSDAAVRAGFEASIGNVIDDALDGHTGTHRMRRGDVVRLVAQEITVLGEFSRYAGIEALEYRPVRGDPLRIYFYEGQGHSGYFDARGRAPGTGGWRKPVKGAPITSKFNPKRLHPILKKIMPHNGTDFGAPAGTPVSAASHGTISYIGDAGPSGNLIKLDHPGGIETGYAHLLRFEPGLKVGDHVDGLQTIGYVGSTGRSTGPHLHFTAKKDGKYFDSETLKLDALVVLPRTERDKLAVTRAKYDILLEAVKLPEPLEDAPSPDPVAAGESEPSDSEAAGEQVDPSVTPVEAAPAANAREAVPSTPSPARGSVYLSDRELMNLQPARDDGEVDE